MWRIPTRTAEQDARAEALNKRRKGDYPCVICGLRCPNPKVEVHLGEGGSCLVTDEEAAQNPGGDMYWYPIGPECWRKYRHEIWMYSSEAHKGPPKPRKAK